jgi:hypothetical protein
MRPYKADLGGAHSRCIDRAVLELPQVYHRKLIRFSEGLLAGASSEVLVEVRTSSR